MGLTILVVDDEPRIVQLVRDYLEHGGFPVLVASDGPAALRTARTGRPDLVVLDLGLPGLDGLDVTRSLRREGEVPIIMLTARTEESDKLIGLELGADDARTKPFSPKELVARVRAVLRRAEGLGSPSDVIRVGPEVELDVPRMEAGFGGGGVDLTKTEFQLLSTMARQPGRVFTRAQLLDAVRGVAFESYERAIDAHIKNIRKKVEPGARARAAAGGPPPSPPPAGVAGGRAISPGWPLGPARTSRFRTPHWLLFSRGPGRYCAAGRRRRRVAGSVRAAARRHPGRAVRDRAGRDRCRRHEADDPADGKHRRSSPPHRRGRLFGAGSRAGGARSAFGGACVQFDVGTAQGQRRAATRLSRRRDARAADPSIRDSGSGG